MKQLIERLTKLLTIKSITTLLFAIAYVVLLFLEIPIDETFKNIIMTVIAFYYGTQATKD